MAVEIGAQQQRRDGVAVQAAGVRAAPQARTPGRYSAVNSPLIMDKTQPGHPLLACLRQEIRSRDSTVKLLIGGVP